MRVFFFFPKLRFSRDDEVNILTSGRDLKADGSPVLSSQVSSEHFRPGELFLPGNIQKAVH